MSCPGHSRLCGRGRVLQPDRRVIVAELDRDRVGCIPELRLQRGDLGRRFDRSNGERSTSVAMTSAIGTDTIKTTAAAHCKGDMPTSGCAPAWLRCVKRWSVGGAIVSPRDRGGLGGTRLYWVHGCNAEALARNDGR
jgi:hypothetical protein